MNQSEMMAKIERGDGFIAALDQSGGLDAQGAQGLRNRGGRLVER
jgi:fructose-bisphosphate aldolase class 1